MAEKKILDQQFYFKGADSDTNPELAQTEKGRYIDAKNVRPQSTDGNSGALQKIKGEEVLHTFVGYSNYINIGACNCKKHKIAFWAKDGSNSFISIDGDIVCESEFLPLTYDHPLQIDVNENCLGGEVFPTDYNVPPMIFDVQDMIDSFDAGSDKYFADFDISQYTVILKRQLDMPMFVKLHNEGATNGLKVGYYAYAIRYVDDAGNRTQFSMFTPLIPVIAKKDFDNSSPYPNTKVHGSEASTMPPFGITIKYRVFNEHNYSHIELKRIAIVSGAVLGSVPVSRVTEDLVPLVAGESSIRIFKDNHSVIWTELTDQEDTQTFNTIDTAKAIRYYQNQLILMNIKYVSKDLENTDIQFLDSNSGNKMYAFKHKLGSESNALDGRVGFKDPYNSTYYKHYMGGETYGLAMLCFDGNGDRAFVLPIPRNATTPATEGINIPNRREKVEGDSSCLTNDNWKGSVAKSVDIHNTTNVNTFEVSDIAENPTAKSNFTPVQTLSEKKGDDYNPLTPLSQEDINVADHEFKVNQQISLNSGNHTDIWDNANTRYYNPNGYTPEYYSTGIAIQGISGLPSWVEAFTIVRTAPAGRVVAQGLATYHNLSLTISNGNSLNFISKAKNKIKFISDDLNFFARIPTTDHKVQFVAPIGMFSEVYNSNHGTFNSAFDVGGSLGTNVKKEVELMSYARVVSNNPNINPGLERAVDNDITFFTEFGRWRNTSIIGIGHPFYDASAPGNINGNRPFGINAVPTEEDLKTGRGKWWSIELDRDLYEYDGLAGGHVDINDILSQNYAEPVYIANIIDEDATIPDNNINSYIETGHYQKMRSIIGVFNMANTTSFELADERIEDAAPSYYPVPDSAFNSFIYVEDSIMHTEKAWLNVTYKSQAQIIVILDEIVVNTFYEADMGGGNSKNIYGIYIHDYDERISTIRFTQSSNYSTYNPSYFFPSDNSKIIIKYDNRVPLKVFGGDCSIGETVGATVDGLYDDNGDPIDEYPLYRGMPYMTYKYNNNYKRIKNADSGDRFQWYSIFMNTTDWGGNVDGFNYAILEFLRQHVWMYTAESRLHIPYMFDNHSSSSHFNDQSFPNIHYIMRPEKWSTTEADNFDDATKIHTQYQEDYPDEFNYWQKGGILFGNQGWIEHMSNLDYSAWNTASMAFTKPAVGYEEKNVFCTAVAWSEPREINEQNSPSLRSFSSGNVIYISDAQGAIKYAYDTETSKGENLYAITDNGVCLLLTNKTTMADALGNTVGYTTPLTGFIQLELWLSKDIGMNDEMWRSAAEHKKALFWANEMSVFVMFNNQITDIAKDHKYYKRVYGDGLSKIEEGYTTPVTAIIDKKNEEYWLNIKQTAGVISIDSDLFLGINYVIIGNDGTEDYAFIAGYTYEIDSATAPSSPFPGFHHIVIATTGLSVGDTIYFKKNITNNIWIYDTIFDVANIIVAIPTIFITTASITWDGTTWIGTNGINLPNRNETFVYGIKNEAWHGTYDYFGERFITIGDRTYSVKNTSVYELGIGYDIDGNNVMLEILNVSAPSQMAGKEFIDVKIASNHKPTSIEFSTTTALMPECALYEGMSVPPNTYYLKDYNGWYNHIPRKLAGSRDRMQGRSMFYRIRYDGATEFNLIDTVIGSKILKIQ